VPAILCPVQESRAYIAALPASLLHRRKNIRCIFGDSPLVLLLRVPMRREGSKSMSSQTITTRATARPQ
jgi:hypothetical protein